MQVVEAPVLRMVAIAGAALAFGALVETQAQPIHRLLLHAPLEAGAAYLSAWLDGEVRIAIGDELRPITFTMRAEVSDGCRWLGTETLIPIDARTFRYSYDE